jgi:deazaflavin-dependent oxidoreductase (nitroreductase family)
VPLPFNKTSLHLLRFIHYPPQLAYALGLGPVIGKFILLLKTHGRKTGLNRVTPLQYEIVEGAVYVASARGMQADWVRNILANPQVSVRLRNLEYQAEAEVITSVERIVQFLELRLQRHPHMIKAIMKSEGITFPLKQNDLEEYARHLALIVLNPVNR